jgi:serine/threonine protein phosphatase PrpC
MAMKLQAWSKSDPGRRRARNEDSFLLSLPLGLFAVADGMGGHQGGETASRLAVAALAREVAEGTSSMSADPGAGSERRYTQPITAVNVADLADFSDSDVHRATQPHAVGYSPMLALLRHAARQASREIHEASRDSEELRGMGTTLTAILCEPIGDNELIGHVLHAGDSRLYRFSKGKISQLTHDHTWIAEQMRVGAITEAEAAKSRFRHVITKSIGFERFTDIDMETVPLVVGDTLLLCSDGLTNYIENDELQTIMTQCAPSELPERLVTLANDRGGDDNITVVVVSIG